MMFTFQHPSLFDDLFAPELRECDTICQRKTTSQDDKEFRFSIDVPGVKAKDIEVTIDQGILKVSGFRRKVSRDGETVKKNRFMYSTAVDKNTELSKVAANLSDGVLVVTAPKSPRPKPIVVKVTAIPRDVVEEKSDDNGKVKTATGAVAEGPKETLKEKEANSRN